MTVKDVEILGKSFKIHAFDNYEGHPSWYTYEDEKDLRELFWKNCDLRGGTFLDCGAAFGAWSLSALALGAQRIMAWSPQWLPGEEAEAEVFVASLKLNGDWGYRSTVYRSALYDKPGYLNLGDGRYLSFKDVGDDFSPVKRPKESPGTRTAPWMPSEGTDYLWSLVQPLDSWRQIMGDVRWIKFDVEGAELEVIRGSREVLKEYSPTVIVEHHNYMKRSLEQDTITLMGELGYTCINLISKSNGDLSHGIYRKVK